jgi:hypothetical protein
LVLLLVGTARAEDGDRVEAAWAHRSRGEDLFQLHAFAAALGELEEAEREIPGPELDYDIARCLDRLDRFGEAIARYHAAQRGNAAIAEAARERVVELEARVAQRTRAPRSLGPPVALGAGALVLTIVGGTLVSSVAQPLADLRVIGCAAGCADAEALHRRAYGGYALLGAAAVATIADVVLWARWGHARRRPARWQASFVQTGH